MENIYALWERALKILEKETEGWAFNTWIKEVKPVAEFSDGLFFEVPNEDTKNIFVHRFSENVKSALLRAAKEMDVSAPNDDFTPTFLTRSERAQKAAMLTPEGEEKPEPTNYTLNPNFTFDNFVVGPNNDFTHAACIAVADRPGVANNNPLFIYGSTGLGKTHLMHAIGNYVNQHFPNKKIMFVNSETFVNELISIFAASGKENRDSRDAMKKFREKYRKIDLLLMDDIQFISGKDSSQEEFFHTFEELHRANKQVVITSDRPPKDMALLEARLRSRFEGGILTDVQAPQYETKVAILMRKARDLKDRGELSYDIKDEIFHYIASKSTSDVRQLEGALNKVIAYASFKGLPAITLESANVALFNFFSDPSKKSRITPQGIIDIVCSFFDISDTDIKSKKKDKQFAYPRQIAMYLIRTQSDCSYEHIGGLFGGKHYSTVMHAEDTIKKKTHEDLETERIINDLMDKIKE